MDIPESKVDRKTIFLSFLDAREQDLEEMQEVLEGTGLNDKYRIIVTAKPIQVTRSEDAVHLLHILADEERKDTRDDRWEKVYHSLRHIEQALNRLDAQVNAQVTSGQAAAQHLSVLTSSIQTALPLLSMPSFYSQNAYLDQTIAMELKELSKYTPKEGVVW